MILKTIINDRDGWTLYHSQQRPLPRYHPGPRKPMAIHVMKHHPRPLGLHPLLDPVSAKVPRTMDWVWLMVIGAVGVLILLFIGW